MGKQPGTPKFHVSLGKLSVTFGSTITNLNPNHNPNSRTDK